MKTSFTTFACPQWTAKQVLSAAQRHGYQGVEFRIDARHHHGVEVYASAEERRQLRNAFRKAEVEICCLATSLQFISDKVMLDLPDRLRLAADLECPALRVFCGPIPTDWTLDEVVATVGKRLEQAAKQAETLGVDLWLETHDSFCKAEHAAAAVAVANHPRVGIIWDNMHPYRMGESLEQTVKFLGQQVRHTHWHDALNKPDVVSILPLGQGQMPMDQMFQALMKMDYQGYLGGEWFNDSYGPDPDLSLAQYKQDMVTLAQRNGVTLP